MQSYHQRGLVYSTKDNLVICYRIRYRPTTVSDFTNHRNHCRSVKNSSQRHVQKQAKVDGNRSKTKGSKVRGTGE